jgi:hypothetical protein
MRKRDRSNRQHTYQTLVALELAIIACGLIFALCVLWLLVS